MKEKTNAGYLIRKELWDSEFDDICFNIEWTYSDTVPNKKIRGTVTSIKSYPPKKYGKGEWTAKTLKDAYQMACDFADGVD